MIFVMIDSKINIVWHKANRLGVLKGSAEEKLKVRAKWHKGHLKNCHCRTDMPENLKKYI
jgi:hypothetical protein